jgi:enoyl-CoA hydratase/carnithine racemase
MIPYERKIRKKTENAQLTMKQNQPATATFVFNPPTRSLPAYHLDTMNQPEPSTRGTLSICRRGKKASILLVALNRPHVRNAMNDDVYEDLIEVLRSSAQDPSVSAVVLTGTGSYFSSGADLTGGTFTAEAQGRQTLHKPAGRFMMEVIGYPKILAAAVNGPAVGIGMTTLFHCDLVYCSSKATFWAPFTRLALIPELCSSVTFMAAMGLPKANEMLLLGKKIDAKTAVDWNISSRVVQDVDLSGDPCHPKSLASFMCNEINSLLLSLPMGDKTASYFVSMMRGSRRKHLQSVCYEELLNLDERFDSGHAAEAARALRIGSKAQKPKSRL